MNDYSELHSCRWLFNDDVNGCVPGLEKRHLVDIPPAAGAAPGDSLLKRP
jgi:hypothetical protein